MKRWKLLTEPWLARLPITPTALVPFGRRGQALITLSGTVPTQALREAILQLVRREAAAMTDNHQIEDELFVDPLMWRRAA